MKKSASNISHIPYPTRRVTKIQTFVVKYHIMLLPCMFASVNDCLFFLFWDIILANHTESYLCFTFSLHVIFLRVILIILVSCSLFSLLYGNPLNNFTTTYALYWEWFGLSLVWCIMKNAAHYDQLCSCVLVHICMIFSRQWSSKCSPCTCSRNIIWGFIRNASFWVTCQAYFNRKLEVGSGNVEFNLPSRWFWCTLKVENYLEYLLRLEMGHRLYISSTLLDKVKLFYQWL